MYLKLKITGQHLMHGRLPGEEFYVRADDNSGQPVNALWTKRLAEEAQFHEGHVTILERVQALPNSDYSIDEPANLPPAGMMPPLAQPGHQDLEKRILEAVARALTGIRNEIKAVTSTAPDLQSVFERINAEMDKIVQRVDRAGTEKRVSDGLLDDAWRVRMTLPPGWHTNDPVNIAQVPPLIDAFAFLNHDGNVGAAAMALTEADMRWQQNMADAMKKNPQLYAKAA